MKLEALENTANILHGAMDDSAKLIQLHLNLARAEGRKVINLTTKILLAGFLLAVGLIPPTLMLVIGLRDWLHESTELKVWQCELIVGGSTLAAFLLLAYFARLYLLKEEE